MSMTALSTRQTKELLSDFSMSNIAKKMTKMEKRNVQVTSSISWH